MFTADAAEALPVPGRPYGFGQLRLAQAIGDFQALQQHGRRVLRFHLGPDPAGGLERIGRALQRALDAMGVDDIEEAA
jgi:hypothetical protein